MREWQVLVAQTTDRAVPSVARFVLLDGSFWGVMAWECFVWEVPAGRGRGRAATVVEVAGGAPAVDGYCRDLRC